MENHCRKVFSNTHMEFDAEYASLSNLLQQKFDETVNILGDNKGLLYEIEELASSLWILETKFSR